MPKLLAIALFVISQTAVAEILRVGIASSFSPAFNQIQSAYAAQTNAEVKLSRASSGKLYAQALHGAPFDLIIFADSKYSLKLTQELPSTVSSTAIASGNIALLTRSSDCQLRPQSTLAIANPKTAPYGRAAKQALKQLNPNQQTPLTIATAENAAQALHFFATGNADYVITSSALINTWLEQNAEQPTPQQIRTCPIPQSDYDALHYDAVLLTAKAKPLLDAMQSPSTQALLNSLGYNANND